MFEQIVISDGYDKNKFQQVWNDAIKEIPGRFKIQRVLKLSSDPEKGFNDMFTKAMVNHKEFLKKDQRKVSTFIFQDLDGEKSNVLMKVLPDNNWVAAISWSDSSVVSFYCSIENRFTCADILNELSKFGEWGKLAEIVKPINPQISLFKTFFDLFEKVEIPKEMFGPKGQPYNKLLNGHEMINGSKPKAFTHPVFKHFKYVTVPIYSNSKGDVSVIVVCNELENKIYQKCVDEMYCFVNVVGINKINTGSIEHLRYLLNGELTKALTDIISHSNK